MNKTFAVFLLLKKIKFAKSKQPKYTTKKVTLSQKLMLNLFLLLISTLSDTCA